MLSEQGYEVHYASMGEEEILDCDKSFVVPFTRSPFGLSNIKAYKQLKQIIDREHYDIIHTHTPMGSVVTRLAARAARKNGTKVIYTAHGFHFFKGAPLQNWLIYYPVERYMARHTDTLITINNEDYKRAKSQFKTDVQYIPGVGVDLTRFYPVSAQAKQALRKEYGYSKSDFVLIYAAELNTNKNQSFLITQVGKLKLVIPDIKLILCGEGSRRDSYVDSIHKQGLGETVILAGYRNDINKLFQLSDICVASSIREGLGLNLVEAMSTGLPLVASNNRGHRDVIREKLDVLYNIGDGDTFLNAIINFYSQNKQIAESIKRSADDYQKYALPKILTVMALVYSDSVPALSRETKG